MPISNEIDFSKTCFVIMPFSSPESYDDHFTKIYNQIFIPAIKKAGYEPYRTDENKICDSIINKIFDGVQKSAMVLCDLSSRNPNVLYELGLRQAYDTKACIYCLKKLIQEKTGLNNFWR